MPRTKPDLVEFAEKHLGVELQPWQKEIMKSFNEKFKGKRVAICMPKNYGRRTLFKTIEQFIKENKDGFNTTAKSK